MHTLTKVFIVLWALLSVFVMALAVPLVMNNDTWKARYQKENGLRIAAENSAKLASRDLDLANIAKAQSESALNKIITDLREELASKTTQVADLRSRAATLQQEKDADLTQSQSRHSPTRRPQKPSAIRPVHFRLLFRPR